MKVIGLNTPEEMALPPAERPIKVGTIIDMNATSLMLALNEFAEDVFIPALQRAAEAHHAEVDTMELARDFTCKKIREQWEQKWAETHKEDPK